MESTAPIKIVAGHAFQTPEDGTIEFDGHTVSVTKNEIRTEYAKFDHGDPFFLGTSRYLLIIPSKS